MSETDSRRPAVPWLGDRLLALLLFHGAMLLYLLTLCPTVYWGDAAEFAWVLPTGGIAHPSGYPLFTLLARLSALVPGAEMAARINAVAAVAGAGAVALLFLLARELRVPVGPAIAAALCFALNQELWLQSTAAEVYGLHVLLLGGALLVASRAGRTGRPRDLGWLGLLCGLAFSNHLTTMLWAPALVALLWPARRRFGLAGALLAVGGLALGLLPYLYLPLAAAGDGPGFVQGDPDTLARFWAHVTGAQYRYRLFALGPGELLGPAVADLGDLALRGTPLAVPAGLAGLAVLWRRDRRSAVALGLLVLVVLAYVLNYNIPDRSGYLLPVDLVLALGTALALAWVIARWLGERSPRLHLALLAGVVVLTAGYQLTLGRPGRAGERSLPEYAAAALAEVPPDGALFLEDVEVYHGIRYLQTFHGQRTDVVPVSEYLLRLPWYLDRLGRDGRLTVPPRLTARLDDWLARVARADGRAAGRLSQQAVEEVARALIGANLDGRAVRRCPHHDREWAKRWLGFPLRFRGLTYEVARATRPDEDFALDHLPGPAGRRKSAQVDPKARFAIERYAVAFNRRSIVRARLGRLDAALADLEVALAYNPDYAGVYKNLGVIHAEFRHDLEAARPHWEEFLRRKPNGPEANKIRRRLGQAAR